MHSRQLTFKHESQFVINFVRALAACTALVSRKSNPACFSSRSQILLAKLES